MSKFVKAAVWAALVTGFALPSADALGKTATLSGRVSQWAPAAGKAGRTGLQDLGKKQWVKGEYNRYSSGGKKKTLWNKSGYRTKVYSGNGSRITKIHPCEEYDWKPDKCTAWVKVKG
ncbi:hypothetical protein [Actinomadura parmotrematis]|uniref:Uncharacterized protein n=1 Tax=Actinomadura parmotrematis TaxID=2864039 RepID=A0ABS7FNY0_9ACTN|nr:hypothetical protein [Actinomadura parmotrematis]MBW8481283.1 hypothetical protein [Actinomadura parmotrematis]